MNDISIETKELVVSMYKLQPSMKKIIIELHLNKHVIRDILFNAGVDLIRNAKPDGHGRINRECYCHKCKKNHIKKVNYTGPKLIPPYQCDLCKTQTLGIYNGSGGSTSSPARIL